MFKIYYSNSEYNGNPENAPALDVQAIIYTDERVGYALLHTKDYYVWIGDRWRGVDQFGLWDYLAQSGWKKVLFGRTIPDKQFNELYQRVKADRDFGRKNGYLPGERKV